MMDIKGVLLQWFIKVLIKKPLVEQLKMKLYLVLVTQTKIYTNQLSENWRKEKYTHLLWTIFGVQIFQICNW